MVKKGQLSILVIVLLIFKAGIAIAEGKNLILGAAESPEESPQMKRTELILKEAFKRIGYEVDLKKLPAARCLIMSNEGIIDGEAQRIYDLNKNHNYTLNNLVRVPESHQSINIVAFAYDRSDISLDLENPYKSLKKYKIIAKIGIVIVEKNIKRVGLKKARMVTTYDQVFKMLMMKRGNIGIGFSDMIKRGGLLTKGEFKGKPFMMLNPPLNIIRLYVYLNKKHNELVPLVSQKLREMKNDGAIQRIIDN